MFKPVALALAAAALVAAPVAAADPTIATGSLQLGPPNLISAPQAGPNLITVEDGTLGFAGDVQGTGTITVQAVVHPAGFETLTGDWTAPAIVDGQAGVLSEDFVGIDDGTTFSGTITATGSGGLAGLHAHGTFTGQDATGQGTYTLNFV